MFLLLHNNVLSKFCRRSVLITFVSSNGSTRPICTCVGPMPSDRSVHTSYVTAKPKTFSHTHIPSFLPWVVQAFSVYMWNKLTDSLLNAWFLIKRLCDHHCSMKRSLLCHLSLKRAETNAPTAPRRATLASLLVSLLNLWHLLKDWGSWSLTFPSDQQMYTASQYEFRSFPDIRRNSPSPTLRTEDAPTRWLNGER